MPATKLVIVGGVAGGATAAARARRLSEDAQIVVLERGPDVSFANCGLPYHIGGQIPQRRKLLLQTPDSLHDRYNLDVRVRNEVLAIDRDKKEVTVRDIAGDRTYREPYDKLIISTGAAPIRPPLPGIDHSRIFTLRNIPDTDAIKKVVDDGAASAIIVGGGFIGLEMAENLRERGLAVHVVEMLDQVMPPIDREMATAVHQTLALNGVELSLGDAVETFADSGGRVAATLKSGKTLTADLVVLAIGVRPESKLAQEAGLPVGDRGGIKVNEQMQTADPDIYAVGDAVVVTDFVTGADVQIPLAGPANRQGRIAADNIFGRRAAYRGTQGTSIVRIFDLTIGITGSSEKVLRRAGVEYEKVYIHPAQHVGYFPGAEQMHLKLLFARDTGRILGAQITGAEGVDKRTDVLAVAIQSGMSVYNLEEVELAYAPQFGAAKDPINMAGFVAANSLKGDVKHCHADEIDNHENAILLDVRTREEYSAGTIPDAVLIPIDELRERYTELPKNRRILVHCAVGLRGYIGARILSQLGYDAWNLSGGYKTWRAFHPEKPDVSPTPPLTPKQHPEPRGGCYGPTCPPSLADSPSKTNTDSPSGGVGIGGGAASSTCSTAQGRRTGQAAPSAAIPDETLDVRGEQCPGPIVAMGRTLDRLHDGQVLEVLSTDPGFVADVPAWCRQTGHELIGVQPGNGHYAAIIRKRTAAAQAEAGMTNAASPPARKGQTIVVFSNDLDRAMAAFIIANGAASMGRKVTLFFTFWGLNILRRPETVHADKSLVESMFGRMMPRGPGKLSLSKMNMAGMGTAMMKQVMKQKNVAPLPDLIATARDSGVRLVACAMSMDVMGIKEQELIDGVEIGGVGTYLDAADSANLNLFI